MNNCRMCHSKKFKKVINFGKNPLVNSLIEIEDLKKREPVFQLVVEQCQNCHLVQIVNPIDGHKIYREEDYLYFSGDMPGLKDYFKEYATEIEVVMESNHSPLKENDLIIEIGSNDGTMLNLFAEKGFRVLGIDPASNVVLRALRNGLPTISDFFSERLAKSILREYGQAKVIYGNNCIAHLDNLDDLMAGVKKLLTPDGVFIVECNYWGGMVKNKNYALIYHDHFSYFSLKNWVDYLNKFGMEVFDAWVTPAQGGSLRLFASNIHRGAEERLINLVHEEIDTNLNSYKTCQKYEKEVKEEAKKLGDLVRKLKSEGKKIAGYGAAAKGFSVLKMAEIDQNQIDYFVDDSPAKQGKFTPVSHIPVISRKEAEDKLPDYFFITAPNYKDIIINKEREFSERGGKFITVQSEIL